MCIRDSRYTVTITALDGTTVQTYYLEVSNTLSPSGGGSGYSVTVPEKTDHGTVTANPDQAEEGQAVAITVTPEQGYMLEKLTAVDEKGNKLTLTNLGDGKYTFTTVSYTHLSGQQGNHPGRQQLF